MNVAVLGVAELDTGTGAIAGPYEGAVGAGKLEAGLLTDVKTTGTGVLEARLLAGAGILTVVVEQGELVVVADPVAVEGSAEFGTAGATTVDGTEMLGATPVVEAESTLAVTAELDNTPPPTVAGIGGTGVGRLEALVEGTTGPLAALGGVVVSHRFARPYGA